MNAKVFASRRPLLPSLLLAAFLLAANALRAESRLEEIVVHSPSLEGNLLGDSPDRNVTIYLPPGYDENPSQRFPVIYLLHGYTATNRLWQGGQYLGGLNIKNITDALIESGGMRPLILVMPDGENTYMGSWYTNSSVTGNWEDFIVQDLVEYIDSNYRTLGQVASRGIAGHSMGGYGTIVLAMKHPEVYSVVYVMSAAAIAMEHHILSSQNEFMKAITWDSFGGKNFTDWVVKANIALAAAVAPNPDTAPFMADFPVEEVDGDMRFVENVWSIWLEHDPLTMLSTYGINLLQYRGVRIDCGSSDTLSDLIGQNRMFSQALTDANIPHVFEEYDGNHTNRIRQRIEQKVLPFFSEVLSFELEPTAVEATSWGWIKVGVQD